MNVCKTMILTLAALAISPLAVAEIYRCDGPDGPIFSDKKCGADATTVEIENSSGLGGVTDQDKADLAEKKREREQAREGSNPGVINNARNSQYTTESPGRWTRGRDRLNNRPVTGRPVTRPVQPVVRRRR